MIHTYGFHKLDTNEDDLLKLAAKNDSNNDGKKAAAIVGSTAVGGLAGAYSAYKGAKDKEEGKNETGKHAAGHGAAGAVVGGAVGAAGGKALGDLDTTFNSGKIIRKERRSVMKRKALGKAGKYGALGAAAAGAISAGVGAGTYSIGRMATDEKKTVKKD